MVNEIYNLGTVTLFALLIGSFLNVVIGRVPFMTQLKKNQKPFKYYNLFFPRSHCVHCHHLLRWWHNIPLFSYLILKGQCYFCKSSIAKRYIIVECTYMVLVLINYYQSSSISIFLAYSLFAALGLCILIIDAEDMFIPDVLNYLLLWSGLIVNSFAMFCAPQEAIWAGAFGYLGLWGFYHLIFWTSGKQGFGYGDFKLLAAIGAWCGYLQVFNILMISCLLGLIFAVIRMKKIGEPLPFGPALCLAGYLVLLFPTHFNLMNGSHQLF